MVNRRKEIQYYPGRDFVEKKQRFSLRKMKNGVVSVAVGSLLVFAGAADVEAK